MSTKYIRRKALVVAYGREVVMRCNGVHDFVAVEVQYHLRCYREFRQILSGTFSGAVEAVSNKQDRSHFEHLEQYLDTVRLYPTGHYWVDNALLPTLLFHTFEFGE